MSTPLHALLVEDSADDARLIVDELRRNSYDVTSQRVETEPAMKDALAAEPWDIVLADYNLPRFSGLEAVRISRQYDPDMPVILVSGTVGEELAVEAVKAGAHDYVMKDKLLRLAPAVKRELNEAAGRREWHALSDRLAHEQARFRALVERSHESISVLDGNGRITFASPSSERVLGFRPAEMIGRSAFDFVYAEDLARARAVFAEVTKSPGKSITIELRGVRRGGGVRWYEVTVTNELHVPSLQGAVVNCHDITERKEAEAALHTSEARLASAVSAARLGPWEYDVASDRFTFNDHFYAMLRTTAQREGGYTMSSARYAERFVHPDDRAVVGTEIRRALESADPNYNRLLEHRMRYADGETGYLSVRFFVVRNEQGQVVKTYGVNQDITERRRAEDELRLFRTLIERASDEIYVVDPTSGRLLDVNDCACRALGYGRDELLTRTVLDVAPSLDQAAFGATIARLAKTGSLTFEGLHRRKDGSTYPVELSLSRVSLDREYTLTIVRDITERKRARQ